MSPWRTWGRLRPESSSECPILTDSENRKEAGGPGVPVPVGTLRHSDGGRQGLGKALPVLPPLPTPTPPPPLLLLVSAFLSPSESLFSVPGSLPVSLSPLPSLALSARQPGRMGRQQQDRCGPGSVPVSAGATPDLWLRLLYLGLQLPLISWLQDTRQGLGQPRPRTRDSRVGRRVVRARVRWGGHTAGHQ